MKLIYITGDDYAALTYEQEYGNINIELWNTINDTEDKYIIIEDEENYIEVYVYEFKEVDTKFIDFVRSYISDYDVSKTSEFYVVEE